MTQNERPILDGMPLVSPIKMGYKSYNKGDKMKKQTTKDLLRALLNKTTHLKEDRAGRLCMMGYLLGAFNIMSCREQELASSAVTNPIIDSDVLIRLSMS